MQTLEITVEGKAVSGNHRTAQNEDGEYFTIPEARHYAERLRRLAKAAAVLAGWKIPEFVHVDVEIFNIRMDRDNIGKTIYDPLQRIIYHNDSRILDGRIARKKDRLGPRITLIIKEIDGKNYGYEKPQNRTPDRKLKNGKSSKRRLPDHVERALAAVRQTR
jgi:Holliday junction resolvase RusA-like endonuclease